MVQVLSPDDVREFLADYADNNHLLDGVEFTDTRISLATGLALSEYEMTPPLGPAPTGAYPGWPAVLMVGTCWKLVEGQSALLARNTMNYSDGGVSLPVEERMQLYQSLAESFRGQYLQSVQRMKQYLNIEGGWGEVRSDQAAFPIW